MVLEGLVFSVILMTILVFPTHVYANEGGFERISESRLSAGFQLRVVPGDLATATNNLDSIVASYQPTSYQPLGFDVRRINVSWNSEAGKLTVGNDWANFQDILGVNKGFESTNVNKNRNVASQIKWLSANGFSISLENARKITSSSATNTTENTTSPNLILSWQGGTGGVAGEYRISAMGRKFDANAKGQKFDGRDLVGWGLNMEGGWQIDDLFATLAITVGKGIDSYILQKYGDNLVVTPNDDVGTGASISIRPSLYYSLNNNSNFHVSLGHHTSKESFNNSALDTLDTISMGYNWSPWPSVKLDIEFVGQNASSQDGVDVSTQVKINAEKRF